MPDNPFNPLGPARKRDPVELPNLTPQENEKLSESLVVPGGPRIPDAPDISTPVALAGEGPATDDEFLAGGRYKPNGRKSRTGVTFEVVEHPTEAQHLAYEKSVIEQCKRRGVRPPKRSFYVQSNRGTIGWVPYIGAAVVWPWEAGWAADLVEKSDPDPKSGAKK